MTHHAPEGTQTTRRIDLYRRDRFILEAKQGANPNRQTSLLGNAETERRSNIRRSKFWAQSMVAAKGQAEGYVRDLPAGEASPPFLIVCDVGFCFDIYADFSGTGRHYSQFPDREGFRIYLPDLRDTSKRELLRRIWEEPHTLNPAHQRVAVTREIAALLARLAIALEGPKEKPRHLPQSVATFLMRSIFCMFAQSVGLLPEKDSFTELLVACRESPASFVGLVGDLWRKMNEGGFSPALRATVKKFNGGLFAPGPHGPAEPLPVDADMLDLLIQAAKRDWADVEPAIFGTLLENALSGRQRSELGAHFTPRGFVERLVLPPVMEPLRNEWDGVKAGAYEQEQRGDRAAAAAVVRAFHARLCAVRVLDPACGSGNFLYVTMELMKRLEGEVLEIVARIVALNAQRRAEEAEGLVRWLRPEFQAPEEIRRAATQTTLDIGEAPAAAATQWPRNDTAGQYIMLRGALARAAGPTTPAELARQVKGAPRAKLEEMLRVLTALGQAHNTGDGRFTA